MKGVEKYKRTSVSTSDPMDLVVMLYDGFLRFAEGAHSAIQKDDHVHAGEMIGKAMAVVYELTVALDHSKAPQFVQGINSLYAYVNQRLMHANRSLDVESIEEVIDIMSQLRSAWVGAAMRLRAEKRSNNSKSNKIA